MELRRSHSCRQSVEQEGGGAGSTCIVIMFIYLCDAIRSGMLVSFIKTSKVMSVIIKLCLNSPGEVFITNDVKQVSTNLQAVVTAIYCY